jgi:transcriptional regulator with XRE-family HTH domain
MTQIAEYGDYKMNLIIERIINLLSEKDIMAKTFMEDLDLNKSSVSDWKSGKSNSYMKYLPKIADYFGVSVDYLLGNTDIKNKPVINKDDEQFAELYEIIKDYPPDKLKQILDFARFLNSSNSSREK